MELGSVRGFRAKTLGLLLLGRFRAYNLGLEFGRVRLVLILPKILHLFLHCSKRRVSESAAGNGLGSPRGAEEHVGLQTRQH